MHDNAFDPVSTLASELGLPPAGIQAVLALFADGATVPFIARYRKEATGALDEVQIRAIQERHTYLTELEDRRNTILSSIEEQGKLTQELAQKIRACTTKAALEDLYLPYKPKRRTRATIARERGLEPLAERILTQPADGDPLEEARSFVDEEKGVKDAETALAGARDIVAEIIAESADIRGYVRSTFSERGSVASRMAADKEGERTKFEQYYEFEEAVPQIPSHRFLAIRRGEREGVLRVSIEVDENEVLPKVVEMMDQQPGSPFGSQLYEAATDAYRRLLSPAVETDVRVALKMRSDRSAVEVFAENLRNLLLAAPFGAKPVIGIDPGLRTGCKCAVVDATGRFVENVTIHLSRGQGALAEAGAILLALVQRHAPRAIAIGNGTASRETESFVRKTLKEAGVEDVIVVVVSEAGASVYSASDVAREEFPDLDLTVRGAISIARRLQDPLAELVKIDPKSIGVGQYQHDVHQPLLAAKLDEVIESCVNHVGVELNTASAPLLAHIAGIGPGLSKKIVSFRDENGPFESRESLRKVSGVGPRTFQQAAGFLRIRGGSEPLDASAVHPERYELVEKIARDMDVQLSELVGSSKLADSIDISRYIGGDVGEPTLRDIIAELKKPGRDPRDDFEPPRFRDDVHELQDLREGMEFEGVVTNVTNFGAFVDIGVHQDGLVHISQLSERFVKDPHEVVRAGDKLKVRVLEVDLERKRIALTAKQAQGARTGNNQKREQSRKNGPQAKSGQPRRQQSRFSNNPFAAILKG